MICAPVDHFATGFDMSSEMIAPPKPKTAENTSSGPRLSPSCAIARSMPNSFSTIDRTTMTARLVRTKSTIRFIEGLLRTA